MTQQEQLIQILKKIVLNSKFSFKLECELFAEIEALEQQESKAFELQYCEKCIQMTNHLNGICQKCKQEIKDDLFNELGDILNPNK